MLLNMPTGRTRSRAPLWTPRHRHQARLVTPGQLQRLPERGQTVKLGSSQGLYGSDPCSARWGGLLGASCLGSSPMSRLVYFHPSILLCDSVPRASSTGQTNKAAFGRARALTDKYTHVHAHAQLHRWGSSSYCSSSVRNYRAEHHELYTVMMSSSSVCGEQWVTLMLSRLHLDVQAPSLGPRNVCGQVA